MKGKFLPHNTAAETDRHNLKHRTEADHPGTSFDAFFHTKKAVLRPLLLTLPPKNTKNSDFAHKTRNCKRTKQNIKNPLPTIFLDHHDGLADSLPRRKDPNCGTSSKTREKNVKKR